MDAIIQSVHYSPVCIQTRNLLQPFRSAHTSNNYKAPAKDYSPKIKSMKSRAILPAILLCILLSSCVNLPDLIPGGGGSTMTVIPVNRPFNEGDYYGTSVALEYNGVSQGLIRFESGTFHMIMPNGSKVLINPLSWIPLPEYSILAARFLNEDEMVGRVDNAAWESMALVVPPCLGWINLDCTPTMIDYCTGLMGVQIGACTFFNKYIPLQLNFDDGIHYGWLKISKDPFATVYPEKSIIHELAFSNEVGRHVQMGKY